MRRKTEKTAPRRKTPTLGKRQAAELCARVEALSSTLPAPRGEDYEAPFQGTWDNYDGANTLKYALVYTSAGGMTVGRLLLRSKEGRKTHEVLRYWYDIHGFIVTQLLPCGLLEKRGVPHQDADIRTGRALPGILLKIPFRKGDVRIIMDDTLRARGISRDVQEHWYWKSDPIRTIHRLYNDNIFETLVKLGLPLSQTDGYNYDRITKRWYRQTLRMLSSGRKYDQYDLNTWLDYMDMLSRAGRDTSNPSVYMPEDLNEAHARLVRHIQKKEAEARRRQRLANDKQEYQEVTEEDRAAFRRRMQRFSGIRLEDDTWSITTLDDISKHYEDSVRLQHCLFHNHYWEKNNSVVVGIRRKDRPDRPYADAEIDFRTGTILQLYGNLNCLLPEKEDKAIKTLIRDNMNRYVSAGKKTASRPPLNVELFQPAFKLITT